MKRWILALLVMLAASPGWAEPRISGPSKSYGPATTTVTFATGDTADSPAIAVSGFCSVRYQQSSGDDASLYAVTTADTATSSGVLLASFTSSTTAATTFVAGTRWVKAVATDATAGGSVMTIECAPMTSGGGSRSDIDGDGQYEVAYLWDADGDGSVAVTCTADAVPDIACKAVGEVVYRDTIDDVNCAIHDCGNGVMEVDGTLILGSGVFVGFPCWNATAPGNHTAENAEVSDQYHDATGDAAYANCPVDGDGKAMTVISFQDWGGTFIGSGTDAREMHRGLMSASLRRDRGTYLTNDMGPWHLSAADSVWFGGGVDYYRMVSAGFTSNATASAHHTGATAGDGDSKGWWDVYADANWDVWGNDNSLCLRNSNGTAGTDYKTASTVANLERGDILLVPVKTNSNSTSYSYFEVRVRDTPSGTCGATPAWGLRVPLGGSISNVATTSKIYPPYASVTTAADAAAVVVHARSEYANTNVTIANMTIEPQDPWNEVGSRCTNSGSAFRADRDASGTVFTAAGDSANTDFSCDTQTLVGFWGGGRITLDNLIIKNFHWYALDGGSSGGTHTAQNVRWLYGNGGPAWDSGNGWQILNSSIEYSTFDGYAFSVLGPGFLLKDFKIENSFFGQLAGLNSISEGSHFENVRAEGSQFDHLFLLECGSNRNTFRDLYITGRGWANRGGIPAGFLMSCSTTSNPITNNVLDGFVVDPPDLAGDDTTAPAVLLNASSGNSAAIIGNTFSRVRAAVYSPGTDGLEGCIFGAYDFAPGGAPDDGGESILFTNNFFSHSSISANGRVFCVSRDNGDIAVTDSDAGTPAWGDPVGCGNMDGGVVYADENCI